MITKKLLLGTAVAGLITGALNANLAKADHHEEAAAGEHKAEANKCKGEKHKCKGDKHKCKGAKHKAHHEEKAEETKSE